MWVSAILAAGGRGRRMGAAVPKQLLMIGNRSILQRSFDTLDAHSSIAEIVVALPRELAASPPPFLTSSSKRVHVVDGGGRRQDSVANAFARVSERAEYVVIHDAARPLATSALFERVIEAARHSPGESAIAALRASDTVKQIAEEREERDAFPLVARTLARDSIYLAQTPQVFLRKFLAEAIALGGASNEATDEATLVERAGHPVTIIDGEPTNIKITTEQDLRVAEALLGDAPPSLNPRSPRIGVGYDLHRLEAGRKLVIGGVEIPYQAGLMGHSDADVLCHAVTDAILGAVAQGDIGQHFPDTDPRWKGANSLALLMGAARIVRTAGFSIVNVDAVVIAERPKLLPYVEAMRRNLADAMAIDVSAVGVKGKTNEGVDALGRNEAIAVHAVAMLASTP